MYNLQYLQFHFWTSNFWSNIASG